MIKYFTLTTFCLAFFTSCNFLSNVDIKDIKEIKEKRTEFLDKEVSIKGTVESKLGILNLYVIKDNTDEIYVYTKDTLPNKNQTYTVTGIVKERKERLLGFDLFDEVYIEETERN